MKTVLLIEDDKDAIELARIAAARGIFPFQLEIALSGEEALARLQVAGSDERSLPHAVLLDVRLPGMDGLELLRRLREREHTSTLPVIILDGSHDPRLRDRVESMPNTAVLQKSGRFPEFFVELAKLVHRLLAPEKAG